MKNKVIYYVLLVLAVLAAGAGYLLVTRDVLTPIDPLSTLGQALQWIVIADVIVTVPFGLWLHHQGKETLGLVLAGNGMIPGFMMFYLLGAYMPMLYLSGIAAIAWYFARPQ